MARVRMHEDEVATDVALVRRLLQGQLPQWADLPLEPVEHSGTDHDIYRLGAELSVRLPRVAWAQGQADRDARWLPVLAPHLPLAVPVPRATAGPAEGYPFTWSVCPWLPGASAVGGFADPDQAAVDLAAFICALRGVRTTGAPDRPAGARGAPLAELDEQVTRSIAELGDGIDGSAARRCWSQALQAPAWDADPVWLHGDLLPGNLIVVEGRLSGVIDFGLNVGDPACDLQPAWNSFSGGSRERFRRELDADEASWARGRGWALYQAVSALPYYRHTNPGIVAQASHALAEVLAG